MRSAESIHPLTLSFADAELEAAWWARWAADRHDLLRGAIGLLVAIYVGFGAVDHLAFAEIAGELTRIRAVFVALLCIPLPVVYGPSSREVLGRYAQPILLYLAVIAIAGLWPLGQLMLEGPPTPERLLLPLCAGLFGQTCLYNVSGLRFGYAAPVGVAGTVVLWLVVLEYTTGVLAFRLPVFAFLLGGTVTGLTVCYSLERSARLDFLRGRELEAELARTDQLLRNVMPEGIARRLQRGETTVVERHAEAAALFATVTGFAEATSGSTPEDTVALLDELVARFDALAAARGIERIKTIGPTYMAAAGLDGEGATEAAVELARLALEMREALREVADATSTPLELRAGLCAGSVVAGVIGRSRLAYDCWGDTPNTASRLDTSGVPDRLQVDAATAARLRSELRLVPRGTVELKGKGPVQTFWVETR